MALFYAHALHTLHSLWWDLILFHIDIFDRLWVNLREVKPPWPNILNRGGKILIHGIIFLSVFPMVFECLFLALHSKFKHNFFKWKYSHFKDCILIPIKEEYYFDCQTDVAPLDPVQDSDSVPLTYCQPCQEDNVINTSP